MQPELRTELIAAVESRRADFLEFVNQNVILTGASGFIGKWIVGSWSVATELLSGEGRILLTSRNPNSLLREFPSLRGNRRVDLVANDIRQLSVSPSFKPRLMIHGAASASLQLNSVNPLEMIDVITSGTRQALSVAESTGVQKFVFLSSGAVYGRSSLSSAPTSEDSSEGPDITDPKNAYHEAKRMAELLVRCATDRLQIQGVSLRLFAFLAPYLPMDTHFAAGNFLLDANSGREILIRGSGNSIRSYMYGTDLVKCVVATSTRTMSRCVYNVGSEQAVSIQELADLIRQISNPEIGIKVLGGGNSSEDTRYVPDTSRLLSEIGTICEVDIYEAIRRTSAWLRRRQ